jgi:hypothetical protein
VFVLVPVPTTNDLDIPKTRQAAEKDWQYKLATFFGAAE